jgi:hypothetical protein
VGYIQLTSNISTISQDERVQHELLGYRIIPPTVALRTNLRHKAEEPERCDEYVATPLQPRREAAAHEVHEVSLRLEILRQLYVAAWQPVDLM